MGKKIKSVKFWFAGECLCLNAKDVIFIQQIFSNCQPTISVLEEAKVIKTNFLPLKNIHNTKKEICAQLKI